MRTLFIFEPGTSVMHRMDAVSKFVWLLTVSIAVIVASDMLQNGIIFLYVLMVSLFLARIPLGVLLRRSVVLAVFGVWILVTMSLLYQQFDSPVLFAVGPLTVKVGGAKYGVAMFFRVLALGLTGITYALVTHPRDLVNDFVEIGHVPYRIAYAFYAALRFIPLLQSEAANIVNAHAVRGVLTKERSLRGTVAMVKRLTVPLLAIALRRVQFTAIAMDARGFGAYKTRTVIDERPRSMAGVVFAVANILALVAYVALEIIPGGGTGLPNPLEIHRSAG